MILLAHIAYSVPATLPSDTWRPYLGRTGGQDVPTADLAGQSRAQSLTGQQGRSSTIGRTRHFGTQILAGSRFAEHIDNYRQVETAT
jgi:hypothetical protein